MSGMTIAKQRPGLGLKLLSATPYLIQGMFCGFLSSIPLSYSVVPSYYILGLFAIGGVPFSFKFLLAPAVERWSFDRYGKRKSWIVSTIVLSSLLLYVAGNLSHSQTEQHQKFMALVLFFCVLCTTLKDIAADSFVVEIFDASTVSILQFAGAQFGKLTTSPLFLYVVATRRSESAMGMVRKTYIQSVAAFGIFVAALLHTSFDQNRIMKQFTPVHHTVQQYEQKLAKTSFSEIFAHYKKFVDPSYRLFRFAVLLVLVNQGSEIFMEAYPVELIKQGVPGDTLMFGQNVCFVPNILISIAMCSFVHAGNCISYYYLSTVLKFVFMLLLFLFEVRQEQYSVPLYIVLYFLGSVQYFLENICIAEQAKGEFSGLSITLLLSISNLSRLTVLQKMAMDEFGYNLCIIIGFAYSGFLLAVLPLAKTWLSKGASLKAAHRKVE